MDIDIRTAEVEEALAKLSPKDANKTILEGERKAAKYLKPLVKAAAPRGPTGNLRRSVSQFTAKRDKPGAGVRLRAKVAPHRHLVVQGTKQRRTKSGANRGRMTPNPFPAEVADRYGDAALDIAIEAIAAKLDL